MTCVPITVSGEVVMVRRLTVREIVDLSTLIHERSRQAVLRDAKDAGASPADTVRMLREADANKGMIGLLIRHAFTADGSTEIVRIADPERGEAILSALPPDEWAAVALELIGAVKEGPKQGKAESPDGSDT